MRAIILGAVLALGAGTAPLDVSWGQAAPATVTGVWQGSVKAGGDQLPIIIHLGEKVSGDSPAERLFGDPGKLEQAGEKLKVTFQSGGEFEGALGKDGKLAGTFSKGNFSAPLVLEKQAEPKP
jgi:hypothetical protein